MAESRCEGVEDDGRLVGGGHGGREGADGEDFEKFGDVVAVCLVPVRFQGFEYRGSGLFFETGLS